MSLINYQAGREPVNATPALIRAAEAPLPVSGQSLSRKRNWRSHEREFWAADLYSARKYLVEPTFAQTMSLTGVGSTTGVWWALQREAFREEILHGLLPLVPTRAKPSRVPASNGKALLVPNNTSDIADFELINIARCVGVDRMLAAAVAVENGMIP